MESLLAQVCAALDGAASADTHVATLTVVSTDSYMFDSADSPCAAPDCVDEPGSDACMQLSAEYCSDHPFDTGCAQFLPVFKREIGEPATVTLHAVGLKPTARAEVVPATCECGQPCTSSEVARSC